MLLIVSEKEIDTIALKAHPEFRAEKLPSVGMPNLLSRLSFLPAVRGKAMFTAEAPTESFARQLCSAWEVSPRQHRSLPDGA